MPTGIPLALTPDEELEKLRKRVPRFQGVIPMPDGIGLWMARVKDNNGKWHVCGTGLSSPGEAWRCYCEHRKLRREILEFDGKADALLAAAERCRPQVVEYRSLYGSSLDLNSPAWRNAIMDPDELPETRRKK